MRQVTGPTARTFRRWINRAMLIIAVSAMSTAVQMALHGAIAGRHVKNVHWRTLQAWLSLAAAAACLPAAVSAFVLQKLIPTVASAIDRFLPCSVRPASLENPQRKRRDSDADDDTAARAAAADDAAFREVAATYGGFVAGIVSWLQEPDLADNILTVGLSILWHFTMASPVTVLVFDTQLKGGPRYVFWGIAGAVGMLLAAVSLHTVANSGFWVTVDRRKEIVSGGAQAGRQGSAAAGTQAQGQVGQGGAPQGGHKRTSTLSILRAPLLLHGLAGILFLWLHVDRGGQLHWSPFG